MKTWFKVVFLLIFSVLFLGLSGCDFFMGEDGDVYLTITIDTSESVYTGAYDYNGLVAVDTELGLGDSWYLDENYKVQNGSFDLAYALCICKYQYNSYYGENRYHYYINAYDPEYSYTSDTYYTYSCFEYLASYYQDNYSTFFQKTITIQAEEGELFTDGDDRDYTLSLTWDPEDFNLSYSGIALDKTVTTDGDSKVLTFTDGYMTFTVTVPEAPAAPDGNFTSIQGDVR